MTRKKNDPASLLNRKIGLRVSDSFYEKLLGWRNNSNCRSIAELTRSILCKEKIIWYHKNVELESTALELAYIRKELNAIGKNINQITRYFNGTEIPNQKIFHALKVAEEYKKVGHKTDQLLIIISQITKTWLQK